MKTRSSHKRTLNETGYNKVEKTNNRKRKSTLKLNEVKKKQNTKDISDLALEIDSTLESNQAKSHDSILSFGNENKVQESSEKLDLKEAVKREHQCTIGGSGTTETKTQSETTHLKKDTNQSNSNHMLSKTSNNEFYSLGPQKSFGIFQRQLEEFKKMNAETTRKNDEFLKSFKAKLDDIENSLKCNVHRTPVLVQITQAQLVSRTVTSVLADIALHSKGLKELLDDRLLKKTQRDRREANFALHSTKLCNQTTDLEFLKIVDARLVTLCLAIKFNWDTALRHADTWADEMGFKDLQIY